MGSGKTVVGALAAQRANAPFFDLDHLVEDKAGMSIQSHGYDHSYFFIATFIDEHLRFHAQHL